MSWELWLTFVIASTVLLAIPGPTVMLVVSYALGRGRSTGWATVPGVALGDLTAMTVSLILGIKPATRSPRPTPALRSAWANWLTCWYRLA